MRSFLHAASLPLALLLGFGVLMCAVEFRDWGDGEEIDMKAVQTQRMELDRQSAALDARDKVRRRLIGELIDGQLSLSEVTDKFMRLNREPPEIARAIRDSYPAVDERASSARQVFVYAEGELARRDDLSSEQRQRVLGRLEAELRAICKE
jgi:hypothetical protein